MPPRKTWLWFMFILFVNFLLGANPHARRRGGDDSSLYRV